MSKLNYECQREVDEAIHDYGLDGIGYYKVDSICDNCGKIGFTVFKKGRLADFGNCICVKCGCDHVRIYEEEAKK